MKKKIYSAPSTDYFPVRAMLMTDEVSSDMGKDPSIPGVPRRGFDPYKY